MNTSFCSGSTLARCFILGLAGILCFGTFLRGQPRPQERTIRLEEISEKPVTLQSEIGESGEFTWWLPEGAEEYVLPLCAGVIVDTTRTGLMRWLRAGSPWSLSELPVLGLRYQEQMTVVIVPWPHYAELVVTDRIGIRYSFPPGHHQATPCEVVLMRRQANPLEVARTFREWRRNAPSIGAIPRPKPLAQKIAANPKGNRLLGAPHFYLWGPASFSRHDVPGNRWIPFARALLQAPAGSFGSNLVGRFTGEQRGALEDLAGADRPLKYLTVSVAAAIDRALPDSGLSEQSTDQSLVKIIAQNKQALAASFGKYVNPPETWGDGPSTTLLKAMHAAGIDRGLLLLSDLYGRSPRPDVAALADSFGYLLGPYDSYHSVHNPTANPDNTWETAQFDQAAYQQGRIINADGTGSKGFQGRGFHFSPEAAWPYVQRRVNRIADQVPYTAWFVDCDATAECFDDYNPAHPATRVDDIRWRRRRLRWLETNHHMVVGSEGGSVLFADLIDFGQGVHTPYIGHLDSSFRDPESPHYLGRYWPPDTPEQYFKPVPTPPALRTPYFDPTVRIPLYQAALGDEVIATHHWNFDSMKFEDVQTVRELLEILYMVPPMYHINRETWPRRRDAILRHLAFWGPIHRQLAPAPLTGFEYLSKDRLVQRTTFETSQGEVTITVNFGDKPQAEYPAHSATVGGAIAVSQHLYIAGQ